MSLPTIPVTALAQTLRRTMKQNAHTIERASLSSGISDHCIKRILKGATKNLKEETCQKLERYFFAYSQDWIPKLSSNHTYESRSM